MNFYNKPETAVVFNNQKNKKEQLDEKIGRQAGGSVIFSELNNGEKLLGRKGPGSQAASHTHSKGKRVGEKYLHTVVQYNGRNVKANYS